VRAERGRDQQNADHYRTPATHEKYRTAGMGRDLGERGKLWAIAPRTCL